MKITFLGAGSTVFAKNVLGDCMLSPVMHNCDIALYDIDPTRLADSERLLCALNETMNEGRAHIRTYLGVENRREALRGADFVVNAIQVGGYEPCTVIDFEVPKKYGLRQTVGDTMGIGGLFRGLRTIPVLRDFAADVAAVCPNAWFLNYTNPMAILTGYMVRYTPVKTVGLCHSVQVCTRDLFAFLGLEKPEGCTELIAGINHMAWLLQLHDRDGNDLYPQIRRRAAELLESGQDFLNEHGHHDRVRMEYIRRLGYYCTESSHHNAEYSPLFIKDNERYADVLERYKIPLDCYPHTCRNLIKNWEKQKEQLFNGGEVRHERSREYASRIMEAMITDTPYKIGGNVQNRGLITNLVKDACVEVPCLVDGRGIHPTVVGDLPVALAGMNMTNINFQLAAIEAAVTGRREDIYRAAMLDPRCAAELSIDDIVALCDDLLAAHQAAGYMNEYR